MQSCSNHKDDKEYYFISSLNFESHTCHKEELDSLRFDDVFIIVKDRDSLVKDGDFFFTYNNDTIPLKLSLKNSLKKQNLSFRFLKSSITQNYLKNSQIEIVNTIKRSKIFSLKTVNNDDKIMTNSIKDMINKDSVTIVFSYLNKDFVYTIRNKIVKKEVYIKKGIDCSD
mgnify:CR=1 FL=1